jgi:Tol biopolymer transport system component
MVKRVLFISALLGFLVCVLGMSWLIFESMTSGPDKLKSPSSLGLTGRLILTGITDGLSEYDLANDRLFTVYEPEGDSFVSTEAVSPDGATVVYTYAPPPPDGGVQFGYSDLYSLDVARADKRTSLLEGSQNGEIYEYPAWSPDGRYLYFGHTVPSNDTSDPSGGRRLERMRFPDGQPEILANGGTAPHVSPDGTRLTYLTYDVRTWLYALYVANPDGSNAKHIALGDDFTILDEPIFSPDGQYIIFASADLFATPRGPVGLEVLPGMQVARADNVPSDLWRVPVSGGQPERLTDLGYSGIRATFSPDGKRIAFSCGSGIFVMSADSGRVSLISQEVAYGTLEWIP